jgi:hypothetical protein
MVLAASGLLFMYQSYETAIAAVLLLALALFLARTESLRVITSR